MVDLGGTARKVGIRQTIEEAVSVRGRRVIRVVVPRTTPQAAKRAVFSS
jgi:hypothetical protein